MMSGPFTGEPLDVIPYGVVLGEFYLKTLREHTDPATGRCEVCGGTSCCEWDWAQRQLYLLGLAVPRSGEVQTRP